MKSNFPELPPSPPLSPTLAESWLDGWCPSVDLAFAVKRTQDDLKAAGISEAQARTIRAELQSVFDQWRADNPKLLRHKESRPVGLLGGSTADLESQPFRHYEEFATELYAGGGYPPLIALSQKHGARLEAVLFLSEAAAGRFESAWRVRHSLDYVLLDLERDRARALSEMLKTVLPAAEKYWKVKGGPKKREDQIHKREFQALVKPLRDKISTVADLKKFAEFGFYEDEYKQGTLRDWLKELGFVLKSGRPKNVG
jgi:hypothetical protein